jgi:glycosyltransferase involved in cell wall biosynthesis
MQPKVSAVIITYNEAANIARTLNQLYWCDEIIIVDSHSSDDTIDICTEYGCTIYSRHFTGFGEQKRFAVDKAKNDWVLCIDADECLTDKLIEEIQVELKNPGEYKAFQIPMHLVFRGYEFKYGKESKGVFTRLFNKRYTTVSLDKVHESFKVTGPVKKLKGIILHYSYRNLTQYLTKLNCYSSLGAEISVAKKKNKSQALIYISLPFYFTKFYFLEQNFLNGKNGFYWASLCSYYHFIKYIKMQDIRENEVLTKANFIQKKTVVAAHSIAYTPDLVS